MKHTSKFMRWLSCLGFGAVVVALNAHPGGNEFLRVYLILFEIQAGIFLALWLSGKLTPGPSLPRASAKNNGGHTEFTS